ncbi:MAG TPA: hypothetical protein VEU07_13925, partial [Candidatus Acidoferrum sp.]|nr:hypothetical protein [Candidatus Acidoferrum sp.]
MPCYSSPQTLIEPQHLTGKTPQRGDMNAWYHTVAQTAKSSGKPRIGGNFAIFEISRSWAGSIR